MWVKAYLNLGPTRPRWAYLADAMFAAAPSAASRRVELSARVNTFLQTWEVSKRPLRPLPPALRTMIAAANKFGVSLSPLLPDDALRLAIPIWYHIGLQEGRVAMNSVACKCLRSRHNVVTVGDCVEVARRLRHNPGGGPPHILRADCQCMCCVADRNVQRCENPHRCVTAAARAIAKLRALWHPDMTLTADGLSPQRPIGVPIPLEDGAVLFDPSIRSGPLACDSFRVFASLAGSHPPPLRKAPRPFEVPPEEVTVYTDGSCVRNGTTAAVAGAGVWYGHGDPRNVAARVPGDEVSNQRAEMYAVALAVTATPPFARLNIVSD
ncbi:hypothetical protein C2E23DRAFT_704415, partial [Lenzites betulinus]